MGWLKRARDKQPTEQASISKVHPRVFDEHDLPALGRTRDSFTYRYEERWSDTTIDEYFTDHRSEVDRMIPHSLDQAYDVRITGPNGIENHPAPHHR